MERLEESVAQTQRDEAETERPSASVVVRVAPDATDVTKRDEHTYELGEQPVTIGRLPSCDIPLDGDQMASRRHAVIAFEDGVFTIVDLDSSNGVYINDMLIAEQTALRSGDRIRIGYHDLYFTTSALYEPSAREAVDALYPDLFANTGAAPAESGQRNAAVVAALNAQAQLVESFQGIESATPDEQQVSVRAARVGVPTVPRPTTGDLISSLTANAPEMLDGELSLAPVRETELERLQTQLNDIGHLMRQRAEEDARKLQILLYTLTKARDTLVRLRAEQRKLQSAIQNGDIERLVITARETSEHSFHIQYVSQLAEQAGPIASALSALSSSGIGVEPLRELEALQMMIESVLRWRDDAAEPSEE